MSEAGAAPDAENIDDVVPDDVIPHRHLPPLRYRDLPEPLPWYKLVGPGLILAGLSLGSGEFILWPHIVYQSGFVFFWACLLGIGTQYFLNLEIERWTLATGESAITGFCRIHPVWAAVMLVLNIVPWVWPGWATGAAEVMSGMIWEPLVTEQPDGTHTYTVKYVAPLAIAGLWIIGLLLTAGPVVYNTVERIQTVLVALILVLVAGIAALVVRWDAVTAMVQGAASFGTMPDVETTGLSVMTLLGALAFAGAGGTLNLGQSNYVKDKGLGMGKYIGRITSPITGQVEAVSEIGFHFPHTPENLARWKTWWRTAAFEHFLSFFMTCVFCLTMLTLVTYSLTYTPDGTRAVSEPGATGMGFVWSQAQALESRDWGAWLRFAFLFTGAAALLTTELGILDVTARVSSDLVKVNFLRDNDAWSVSRLYYVFLWGEILLGTLILLMPGFKQPLLLIKMSAAMNGGVMLLYSLLLLYLNAKILPRSIAIGPVPFVAMVWSCAFFGYFTWQVLQAELWPVLTALFGTG